MDRRECQTRGVSPVVAVALLMFGTVILSAAVYVTLLSTPTPSYDGTAGVRFDRENPSKMAVEFHSAQTQGDVYIRSPLGTETKLGDVGSETPTLAFKGEETKVVVKTDEGKTVVSSYTPEEYGITYDYSVAKDGSGDYTDVQTAIQNVSEGSTLVLKQDVYTSLNITKNVTIISEPGTEIRSQNPSTPAVSIPADGATIKNFQVNGSGGTGVSVTGRDVSLIGNRITNSETGVSIKSTKCTYLAGNNLSQNDVGVSVSAPADWQRLYQNQFNNNKTDIQNKNGHTLNASQNYAPSASIDTTGPVNTTNTQSSSGGSTLHPDKLNITDFNSGHGNQCGGQTTDSDNPGG